MIRWTIAIVLTLAASGCDPAERTSSVPLSAGKIVPVCSLQDDRITEASGIVASQRCPGCFYVHNDSGGQPRVFLVDRTGQTRVAAQLVPAKALDYEDIALAPGEEPGTFDVCAADIGDNLAQRPNVTIYRFREVSCPEAAGQTVSAEPVSYEARYAEGPVNAEAFVVHPLTGDGYVFTKREDGQTTVYKLAAPWDAENENVLTRVVTLTLPPALPLARIVTGADLAPDGRRLVLRCYVDGWEWRLPADAPADAFDRLLATQPVRLLLAPERQGEAICYAADGQSVLTVSEGEAPQLYEVSRPASASESGL